MKMFKILTIILSLLIYDFSYGNSEPGENENIKNHNLLNTLSGSSVLVSGDGATGDPNKVFNVNATYQLDCGLTAEIFWYTSETGNSYNNPASGTGVVNCGVAFSNKTINTNATYWVGAKVYSNGNQIYTVGRTKVSVTYLTNWITSPTSSSSYHIGNNISVSINTSLYNSASVNYEVWKGGTRKIGPIAGSSSGTSINSSTLTPGTDYRVKVLSTANPDEYDYSGYFTMIDNTACDGEIRISGGGATGDPNHVFAINVNSDISCEYTGEHVWYTSATGSNTINVSSSNGVCVLVASSQNVTTSTSYWVSQKVYDAQNILICESDRIKVSTIYLTNWLTAPSSGSSYNLGDNISVAANSAMYNPGSVQIEIWKGNSKVAGPIAGGTTGSTISTNGLLAGTDYRIKMYKTGSPNEYDYSHYFTLIDDTACQTELRISGDGATGDLNHTFYIDVNSDIACEYTGEHVWYTSATGPNTINVNSTNGVCVLVASSQNVTTSTDYWISQKIYDEQNNLICESDRTKVSTIYLTNWITSPTSSASFNIGENIPITLNTSMYNPASIEIELWKGGSKVVGPITGGTTDRTIATNGLLAGTDYRIKVYTTGSPDEYDYTHDFTLIDDTACQAELRISGGGATGDPNHVFAINVNSDIACNYTGEHVWYTAATGSNTINVNSTNGVCVLVASSQNVTASTSYWISQKIYDEQNNLICESDRTQVSTVYLTDWVTAPSSGSSYVIGENISVSINTSLYDPGSSSSAIQIELWKGDTRMVGPITGSASSGIISTSEMLAGVDYKIKVYKTGFTDEYDFSETFSLTDPSACENGVIVTGDGYSCDPSHLFVVKIESDIACDYRAEHRLYTSEAGSEFDDTQVIFANNSDCRKSVSTLKISTDKNFWVTELIYDEQGNFICESGRTPITVSYDPSTFVADAGQNRFFFENDNPAKVEGLPAGGEWVQSNHLIKDVFFPDLAEKGQHTLHYDFCQVSDEVIFEVFENPVITFDGAKYFERGGNSEVKLVVVGEIYDSYAWYKNGELILNESTSTLTTSEVAFYEVEVTKSGISTRTGVEVFTLLGSQNANYIANYSAKQSGYFNSGTIEFQDLTNVTEGIEYFDALGRSAQSVVTQGSALKRDIVAAKQLDDFGRERKQYLPYVPNQGSGFQIENSMGEGMNQYDGSPHRIFYQSAPNIANSDFAYSETTFEESPLNRPSKAYAPGQPWAKPTDDSGQTTGGGDKPVMFEYSTNIAGKVIYWSLENDLLKKISTYEAGELYKTITTDENGKQAQEFTNLQGQVILKKVQLSETTPVGDEDWLQTYYIYDNAGQLRFVLPPMGTKHYLTDGQYVPDGTPLVTADANFEDVSGPDQKVAILAPAKIYINSGTTLNEGADIYSVSATTDDFILNSSFVDRWSFQYQYDERRRMVEKRVPGAAWVYMIYDERNRLVMTQDGNQRAKTTPEWSFTKYDQLNRPILTGTYQDVESLTRGEMQTKVNDFYTAAHGNSDQFYEARGSTVHGYTNLSFPKEADNEFDYLTVTYYDDYDFSDEGHWALGDYSAEAKAKSLVTGSKVSVSNLGWNETVTLYDNRYRVTSTISRDYLGNKDTYVNHYFSIVHPLVVRTVHTHESQLDGETTTITKDFDFDHADRLMKVTHQINSEPSVVILENEYNELGELITKKLNKEGAGQYSQEVDFQYNIRGWLTKINDPVSPNTDDYFSMQLKYDEAGQYNGNIGASSWKNPFESTTNSYNYTYDPVNRIKSAGYTTTATNGMDFDVSNINYDANGNILSLKRKGDHEAQPGQWFDDLDYDYEGNQLTKVTDASGYDTGFKDGSNATTEYIYDANGNMIEDLNKGIDSIAYNHLNLPQLVKMNGDGSNRIEYIYDAAGIKMAQLVYTADTLTKRTDYQGAFIYEDSVLQIIQHEEGRIVIASGTPPGASEAISIYDYQYHLKDHLGNIRATFKEAKPEDSELSIAYMEDSTPLDEAGESGLFDHYESVKMVDAAILNSTPQSAVAGASHAMRLSGSDDEQFGLARQLKVKPGDKIDVSVKAKYLDPAVSSTDMTNLNNTIIGQIGAVGTFTLAEGILSPSGIGAVDFTDRTEDTAVPMAFLNAFVFDEYFNQINLLSVQISTAAREDGTGTSNHELMSLPTIEIAESGYVYIYLSNEQATLEAGAPIDVFFDDFSVIQHHTPIVSKDDYYPFGLTFASYSRPATTGQNFKYNGKEEIDDHGLNWLDYGARMYMADLGKFISVDPIADVFNSYSPYNYSQNNPIRFVDVDGLGPGDRVKNAKKAVGEDTRKYKQVTGDNRYTDNFVDCSEFCREIAKAEGYDPGNWTGAQADYYKDKGEWVTDINDVNEGDFVFWSLKGEDGITHTGIVTEVGEEGRLSIVQSTRNGGGESINDKYKTNKSGDLWAGTDFESNFVGAGRPKEKKEQTSKQKEISKTSSAILSNLKQAVGLIKSYKEGNISEKDYKKGRNRLSNEVSRLSDRLQQLETN
ncbi:MAG: DUF6443 domain-containing protein [Reichenbachiella sp.]|uniref:DUF6443 domain-containing protein n=1 Tax=Reichenbachiella sp. TaxID=2184521 RepID=UPI0032673D63